jgi:hypothetical protein
MMKIRDAVGNVVAKLKDEDNAPVMVKKVDPKEKVLDKKKTETEEEDKNNG